MTLGMGGNQGALGSPRSSSGSLLEARFSREQCPAAAPRVLQDSVWEKGSAGLIKKTAHQPCGFRSGPHQTLKRESGCLQRSLIKKQLSTR